MAAVSGWRIVPHISFRPRSPLARWLTTTLLLNLVLTTTLLRRTATPTIGDLRPASLPGNRPHTSTIDRSTPGRYVTLCPERFHGDHRTGSHLFLLAAAVYVAEKTNRTVAMPKCGWSLDRTFQLTAETDVARVDKGDDSVRIERYDDGDPPCPCRTVRPPLERPYNGDDRWIDSAAGIDDLRRSRHRSLSLCGLYETYRYADAVGPRLRRLIRFRPEARWIADEFRSATSPPGWNGEPYVRVGVHVRRGDFTKAVWRAETDEVTTVADEEYIRRAIGHFVARHRTLQLVVATDDWHWTRAVIAAMFRRPYWIQTTSGFNGTVSRSDRKLPSSRYTVASFVSNATGANWTLADRVVKLSVAFTEDETRGSALSDAVDLAVLADCDAVVMSTGSFSWWAAWLTNKTAVYHERWPRQVPMTRGGIRVEFDKKLYFPPHWIPLS